MRIERLRSNDLESALALSTQAGWNQLREDWQRLIDLFPETCFAGWMDDRLIATGTLAVYPPEVGWIGMILVEQSWRGNGFGGQMMDHLIRVADQEGIETLALDASDMGRPVYLRKGFADCYPIDRWVRGPGKVTSLDGGAARIATLRDHVGICGLDVLLTGFSRMELIEHLLGRAALGVMVEDSSGVQGFGFIRPGRTARHIGPLVATSRAVAQKLLGALLALPTDSPVGVMIDVPRRSPLTPDLVGDGFEVSRRLTRMARPAGDLPPLPVDAVVTATSFELG